MLKTQFQARFHSDVARAPVRVVADAVHNRLGGLCLQRKRLIEGAKL